MESAPSRRNRSFNTAKVLGNNNLGTSPYTPETLVKTRKTPSPQLLRLQKQCS